ncbi:MAG: hypothetical protein NTX84_09600 [Nitrospirae bacterium]|nr:hypothetical protein [Nitrospirota bacterium]MCX5724744.1 hypothetical protein [Nitrospirota bacterium]
MQPEPTNKPVRPESEDDSGSDNQMRVAGMIVGTALIFLGFLDVFLSISGGFEIDVIPLLIYFGGVAVWANAVVENMTLRYSVIGASLLLAAVFFHYGEVLFWHKQVVFWVTVVVVMYFMFNEPKKPA